MTGVCSHGPEWPPKPDPETVAEMDMVRTMTGTKTAPRVRKPRGQNAEPGAKREAILAAMLDPRDQHSLATIDEARRQLGAL